MSSRAQNASRVSALPPLRQRREDIPLLVNHFVEKFARANGADGKRFSVEAMKLLEAHDWPGNVRELENVVERTLALGTGATVTAADLPGYLRAESPAQVIVSLPEEGLDLERFLDDLRAQLMREALERADGVQTRAAELLGMTFRSFRYYARKAGRGRDARMMLGHAYTKANRLQAALNEYEAVLASSPKDKEAQRAARHVRERLGKSPR